MYVKYPNTILLIINKVDTTKQKLINIKFSLIKVNCSLYIYLYIYKVRYININ